MKPIYLEWIDSEILAEGGWHLPNQIDDMKPSMVKTLGFVYKEADDHYIIVCSAAEIGCYQGLISIPKIAITKALELSIEEIEEEPVVATIEWRV